MEFKLPDLGEGITEGEIVKWLVAIEDEVTENQSLVEIETDKAIVAIPSPTTGKITALNGKPGEIKKVGDVLLVIGGKDTTNKETPQPKEENIESTHEKKQAIKKPKQPEESNEPADKKTQNETSKTLEHPEEEKKSTDIKKVETTATKVAKNNEEKITKQTNNNPLSQKPAPGEKSFRPLATPRVRMKARELGIDLNSITGSGRGGRITEEDLQTGEKASASVSKSVSSAPTKLEEKIPFTGIRKKTAEVMLKSHTEMAQLEHMDEIDVTDLWELRCKEKNKLKEEGINLTLLPFIIKALISGLKKYPSFNATLLENSIILKHYYNIGIALDTEHGLLVPVINNADKYTIKEIAKAIQELSEKGRNKKLSIEEMTGGTITITNVGSIGGRWFTPIINYPESAILGVGRMEERAVVFEEEICKRKMLPIVLSYDHRIADGADAARLVKEIKEMLQDPVALLLGLR